MRVGKGKKQTEVPITIMSLREILKKDPRGSKNPLFYTPKGGADNWYKDQPFANDEALTGGYALVSKEPLPNSFYITYAAQTGLLEVHRTDTLPSLGAQSTDVRRRTAVEAVWDTMFSHVLTGTWPLSDKRDWTSTQTADGGQVGVGGFGKDGLLVDRWHPGSSPPDIGVVTQR